MISGVVVTITMTPFDVISTRLYNQPVDELRRVGFSGDPHCWCIVIAGVAGVIVDDFLVVSQHVSFWFLLSGSALQRVYRLFPEGGEGRGPTGLV